MPTEKSLDQSKIHGYGLRGGGGQLLRPAEVGRILRVSRKMLDRYTASGDLAYVDVGTGPTRSHRRYRVEDLAAFVERRRTSAAIPGAGATGRVGPRRPRSEDRAARAARAGLAERGPRSEMDLGRG
jgi:hypothetical protein